MDSLKKSYEKWSLVLRILRSGHGALPPFLIVVFEAKNGAVEKLRSRPSPLPLGELKEASSIAVLIHQNAECMEPKKFTGAGPIISWSIHQLMYKMYQWLHIFGVTSLKMMSLKVTS